MAIEQQIIHEAIQKVYHVVSKKVGNRIFR